MSSATDNPAAQTSQPTWLDRRLNNLGQPVLRRFQYFSGICQLAFDSLAWAGRSFFHPGIRFGWRALYAQIVRLGNQSVFVVSLVSGCVGLILALQMAPPLADFGSVELIPNIIAVAVFRELGPLIAAVVLTGFAGAAIAAELGTMVVGEEIEALEAHALNPLRFLVVPRLLATTIALVIVTVISELVAVGAGWWISVTVLDIPTWVYYNNTIAQLSLADFLTGLWKAAVFGMIIASIACYNGLTVTGGAAGVGRATTNTVVHSVEAVIFSDLLFTFIFYQLGWT